MVIGDLNARVGEDNAGKERAVGIQGFGCANNNGERLSDICVESRLVICGTLFICTDISIKPHRDRQTKGRLANRPCYYKPEMEEVTTGCKSKSWGRHRKRPCVGGGNSVLKTTKDKTRRRETTAI